jgi:predicted MFS family arabinose efflux permease
VVPPAQYPAAIAQTSMADSTALLIGPPLGGFLYQLAGAGAAIAADACSYLVNALSIFFITAPLQETRERAATPLVADMRAGATWLWQQQLLRHLNLLSGGRTAIASSLYLLIIVLARQDHASSTTIGGIFAAAALAGILGAVAAGRLYHRFRARSLLWTTMGATCILVTCYLLAPGVALIIAVTAAIYAVNPFYELAAVGRGASMVPDALRGRVLALLRMVELGSYALGWAVTGMLLAAVGSTATIALLAALLCVLTLFALLSPAFRELQ